MTKIILSLIFTLITCQTWAYVISPDALKTGQILQLSHQGDGPFDSYLTMELPFSPYENLRKQLEAGVGGLKHRGEAHITVITPPEFYNILKPAGITMDEIESIARRRKIQKSKFGFICVGKAEVKNLQAYYIVVKSEDLLNIRKEIAELYFKKSGDPSGFEAARFYPHITLGFTDRDLHESDGVIKDSESCLKDGEIRIKKD
jgi:hypothetical protein